MVLKTRGGIFSLSSGVGILFTMIAHDASMMAHDDSMMAHDDSIFFLRRKRRQPFQSRE